MRKQVLVPLADGVEEIEAVTLIDVLRRAGAAVVTASIEPGRTRVTGARAIRIEADQPWEQAATTDYDLIVLPGGGDAAKAFGAFAPLIEKLHTQRQAERLYGAICASPAEALAPHGLLNGRSACCYPTMVESLPDTGLADLPVVVDGTCCTSQGPGTAMAFALVLTELLFGHERREVVARALLAH